MDLNGVVAVATANPEVVAIAVPMAIQGVSYIVKKSPWGWDDDLLGWCVKNKAGLSLLGRFVIRKKRR